MELGIPTVINDARYGARRFWQLLCGPFLLSVLNVVEDGVLGRHAPAAEVSPKGKSRRRGIMDLGWIFSWHPRHPT